MLGPWKGCYNACCSTPESSWSHLHSSPETQNYPRSRYGCPPIDKGLWQRKPWNRSMEYQMQLRGLDVRPGISPCPTDLYALMTHPKRPGPAMWRWGGRYSGCGFAQWQGQQRAGKQAIGL